MSARSSPRSPRYNSATMEESSKGTSEEIDLTQFFPPQRTPYATHEHIEQDHLLAPGGGGRKAATAGRIKFLERTIAQTRRQERGLMFQEDEAEEKQRKQRELELTYATTASGAPHTLYEMKKKQPHAHQLRLYCCCCC